MTAIRSRSSFVSGSDLTGAVQARPGGVDLCIYVQPRASRTRWMGAHDGRIKVALAAPPVEGKANKALVAFIAQSMGVPRSRVRLVSGEIGRRKRVFVSNLCVAEALSCLSP